MEQVATFPLLLTVAEVARLFRMTQAAIRRMIRAKEMPALKIGKEYRIAEHVVQSMLQPLTEHNLAEAGFGLWKGRRHPRGEDWVRKQRRGPAKTLEELLREMETL